MFNRKTITALTLALATNLSLIADIPSSADAVIPIEVGSNVPSTTVHTTQGESVQLDDLTQGQPSVIVFYRGGWCPYCTRQLAALGEIEAKLKEGGYQILAISADDAAHAAETEQDSNLGYQILADPKMEAAQAFGLAYQVDQATIDKLSSHKIDIEVASGQTHHLLPVPAVFITDANGTITYRYFDPNYRERLKPEDLLKAAKL
jgi:peroxiredoxin